RDAHSLRRRGRAFSAGYGRVITVAVRVPHEGFDLRRELARPRASQPRVGAVPSFVCLVRGLKHATQNRTLAPLHHPRQTEKAPNGLVDEAMKRWDLYDVLVIHRVGELKPTDQIVLVAVTSAHRGEAFSACEFIMDYLKTKAPFWKKEMTPDGERWVEARS